MIKTFLIILFCFITILVIILFYIFNYILPQKLNSYLKYLPETENVFIKTKNIKYIKYKHINIYLQDAAIASQDERFYNNPGVDIKGTIRAIIQSVISKKRQGASTITEQLAKNLYFNDTDNLQSDILTKILAIYITRMYSKKIILEYYLNIIYFGNNAYGIENASFSYFKTDQSKLNIIESAYLLGLINAPSYLATHPKDAINQAKEVLYSMLKTNYINQAEFANSVKALNTKKFTF